MIQSRGQPGAARRRRWPACCLTVLAVTALAAPASAQIVRGTVTERGSGTPLAGALVSLQDARDPVGSTVVLRQAVTDRSGAYAIRAPRDGSYRIIVRRIGVRADVSVISVGAAETVRHDVELDPFTSLPRVTVVDRSLCTTGRQGERVAALWEEARTALSVIVVSGVDSVTQRRIIRYQRVLNVFTSEIVQEEARTYDAFDLTGAPLFRSLSGDSLSLAGYFTDSEEAMTFFAPDAGALLSNAFLRDHCFGVAEGRGERQGLVGLTFQPVRGRPVNEIRGTLWLDGSSYELQFVEFEWLGLPRELRHDRIGGEVYFMRQPDGRWIVKRWSLRMPRPRTSTLRAAGSVVREALMTDGIAEEGGMIVVQGAVPYDKPATIVGTVARANGGPLSGARVRLVGTGFRVAADAAGRFRFDSIPPGLYALVAEHGDYDVFDMRAVEHEFALEEGVTRQFAFKAAGEKEIADKLCPGRDWRRATLRITLVDERTQRPMPGVLLRLRSLVVKAVMHGDVLGREAHDVDIDVTTNPAGVAMFCSVATGQTVTLGYPVDSTGLFPLHTFRLEREQNQIATVKAAPP
jgi:hypothetical protein